MQNRETDEPVEAIKFFNQTDNQINAFLGTGNYRLTDIEVAGTNPMLFTGAIVRNVGEYTATSTMWYYNQDAAQIDQLLIQNQARLIDIERYYVGGQAKFACIMVDNTGPGAKSWMWVNDVDQASLDLQVANFNGRIIDLETHFASRLIGRRFDAIVIHNTGDDYANWLYAVDQTQAQIQFHLALNHRIIDTESEGAQLTSIVAIHDSVDPHWRDYGLNPLQIHQLLESRAARLIDIEPAGGGLYDVVMVDNHDPEPYGTNCGGAVAHRVDGEGLLGDDLVFLGEDFTPNTNAFLLVGFNNPALPLDLIGMPGCMLWVDPVAVLGVAVDAAGDAGHTIAVPVTAAPLVGVGLLTQYFAPIAGANALDLATTNGVRTQIRY